MCSLKHLSGQKVDSSPLLMDMSAMVHELEIDEQGVVHARDTDGENVIYDAAYNQLFQMEALVSSVCSVCICVCLQGKHVALIMVA